MIWSVTCGHPLVQVELKLQPLIFLQSFFIVCDSIHLGCLSCFSGPQVQTPDLLWLVTLELLKESQNKNGLK